ncbi:hypothetical protein BB8028_0001g15930 [Beauveria bassiana]|uniref:Kazal-like domain-containing protein n=1 Tax=Beauveria bassiana TaxID=176275 RepID=A0A2S7Y0S1_BEABA|nr:hypothetical protein BB8028_0001g15930 [Beauveria bassiana]
MKFVAVIFAVVTVASSMPMEQQKCGGFCTAEYDPIKCTNGVVYGNACELAKAKVGYWTHNARIRTDNAARSADLFV